MMWKKVKGAAVKKSNIPTKLFCTKQADGYKEYLDADAAYSLKVKVYTFYCVPSHCDSLNICIITSFKSYYLISVL